MVLAGSSSLATTGLTGMFCLFLGALDIRSELYLTKGDVCVCVCVFLNLNYRARAVTA